MPSFGEKLKLEREKRAVTLEQISVSTKIGMRMLQALEEDKFTQLPGGIFNKGFVRAYARHLGLDEDQTITDYLLASGEGPAPNPEAPMAPEIAPPQQPAPASRPLPWGLFATILLLVALALWFWSRSQHNSERHSSQPAVPPATPKTVTNSETGGVTPVALSDNVNSAGNAISSKAVDAPAKPASTITGNAVTPAAEIAAAAPAPGEFTLLIVAREESWISIKADGKTVFEETMLPETEHAVRAQKEVVIRAGNTGALDFVFNGKKLDSQGDYGEVKTLTFGSHGLLPTTRPPASVQ